MRLKYSDSWENVSLKDIKTGITGEILSLNGSLNHDCCCSITKI